MHPRRNGKKIITFLSHNSFNKKILYFILKGNYIQLQIYFRREVKKYTDIGSSTHFLGLLNMYMEELYQDTFKDRLTKGGMEK